VRRVCQFLHTGNTTEQQWFPGPRCAPASRIPGRDHKRNRAARARFRAARSRRPRKGRVGRVIGPPKQSEGIALGTAQSCGTPDWLKMAAPRAADSWHGRASPRRRGLLFRPIGDLPPARGGGSQVCTILDTSSLREYSSSCGGAVAQLGEHKAGSLGVRGSSPLSSTIFPTTSVAPASRTVLAVATGLRRLRPADRPRPGSLPAPGGRRCRRSPESSDAPCAHVRRRLAVLPITAPRWSSSVGEALEAAGLARHRGLPPAVRPGPWPCPAAALVVVMPSHTSSRRPLGSPGRRSLRPRPRFRPWHSRMVGRRRPRGTRPGERARATT
jgi:hypothetical protein